MPNNGRRRRYGHTMVRAVWRRPTPYTLLSVGTRHTLPKGYLHQEGPSIAHLCNVRMHDTATKNDLTWERYWLSRNNLSLAEARASSAVESEGADKARPTVLTTDTQDQRVTTQQRQRGIGGLPHDAAGRVSSSRT